jgi:hypothetical protein
MFRTRKKPAPIFTYRRRSEVTAKAQSYLESGCNYYRTHLECECRMNNYRQGVLVIKNDRIVCRIVRCAALGSDCELISAADRHFLSCLLASALPDYDDIKKIIEN